MQRLDFFPAHRIELIFLTQPFSSLGTSAAYTHRPSRLDHKDCDKLSQQCGDGRRQH
ncbi:hypothetical protein FIBSPDRAFT_846384 [Athelia psychrophila]|uniref:Uncharacterized protein n=1 Tax=Athelia psychrophila TaxID=1759441 RepID=A0A166WZI4_9AGAM|nr:hypothetical protein FIBSPDRAFT_878454 [Fibularhizoctonia sp. CBS 109695]KZP34274.1 hypothetical protein FIBSPDRAFT_846384 [Fibularhizoctonia sp. CBS 109695]